jgi:GGDEF domain-containing protein
LQIENERLKDKIRLLEQRVCFDGLTGLSRRELCLDVLDKLLADPTIQHVSVVFLDLDNLKTINDKFGHDAGDQAICYFSNMLKQHGGKKRLSLVMVVMSLLSYFPMKIGRKLKLGAIYWRIKSVKNRA